MPVASAGFYDHGNLLGRNTLAQFGPTIEVNVGIDAGFQPGVSDRPALPDRPLLAIVDTGAAVSCIDSALAIELGLPVADRQDVAGVHGAQAVNLHAGQMYVPLLKYTLHGLFHGVHLSDSGQPHAALIDRDFLRDFTMNYDGRTGAVTISND